MNKSQGLGRKLWSICSPMIIYFLISLVVTFIIEIFIAYDYAMSNGFDITTQYINTLYSELLKYTLIASLISAIVAIPFLNWMMKKDKKQYPATINFEQFSSYQFIYCFIAGITASLAGSALLTITQIGSISSGYDTVNDIIYSSNIWIQIISAGIVIPIVEEIVFRGLTYTRLKRLSNPRMAMIVSALIFGLYHGNLMQFLFAFGLGLLLSYIYETYKSLTAPVIFHIGANLVSIVLQEFLPETITYLAVGIVMVVCVLITYLMVLSIRRTVHVTETTIPLEPIEPEAPTGNTFYERRYRPEDYYPKNNNDDEAR